uniref:MADF domain-containing protein n=1 Tax=Oryzias latipes TaxID=8090 RepID=A0A3P9L4T7_ORYLA
MISQNFISEDLSRKWCFRPQMMNVELLVSLVSEHKELYGKRESDYKNLDKREQLWSGIAQQMGLDVEEVKQKWKSLRDTYTRKKREEDCRSGQVAKQKKAWKFMKVMEFLAASTEFRRVDQVVINEDVSDREASASTSSGLTFSSPTVRPTTCNKRKRPETPDLLDRYLLSKEARENEREERRREKEERREQRREKLNDENYLFPIGLIPTLRRLSPAVQSSVKLRIHQLLHDAEFGQASSAVFPQHSPVSYHQLPPQTPPNYGCSTSWQP